jgi:phospholipid transport system substrate-binding protein
MAGARAAESATPPETLVTAFHDQLIQVMKNAEALGYQGRYDKLAPAVTDAFHLRLMTQITAGASWRKAAETEKTALVDAFSKVSIATYASRFDGYSGQRFETVSVKDGPQETRLVDTRLVNPDGEDVALTYVTKVIDGGWRIIDVVLDGGISELAVRRSEYRRVLKSDGIAGLIAMLNGKARAMQGKAG